MAMPTLPEGDYVSPGLEVIIPDRFFPDMIRGNPSAITSPFFQKEVPHAFYVHKDFLECGFLNRDEAAIVYNNAIRFLHLPGLEIGSHVGWSSLHIALAGVRLDVVEPQLKHDPRVLLAVIDSLRRANVHSMVSLHAGFSPEKVEDVANTYKRRWNFILIDGNHNPGYPLRDAQVCEKYAAEDNCMILFHDLVYPAVAEGLKYFKDKHWNIRIYQTQQIIGCAWRGNIPPVDHIPDPCVRWSIPGHLECFM